MKLLILLVIISLATVIGFVIGNMYMFKRHYKTTQKAVRENEKRIVYLRVAMKWMEVERKGMFLKDYLSNCGYKRIAIYGYDYFGRELEAQLCESDITVSYIICGNKNIPTDKPVFWIEDGFPKVDLIIVTDITEYLTAENIIQKNNAENNKVKSLEDLIYEMQYE